MKPILVLYATREGQTRRIAEHIGAELRTHGFDADMIDAAKLPSEFTLRIGPDSPSFSLARALQGRLSGHTAIVFVRTYSTEAGEAVYHFHVVPDDPAVAAAVREATSLDRVALTGDGGAPPKK